MLRGGATVAGLVLLGLICTVTGQTPSWYKCDCSGRNNCMCPSQQPPGSLAPEDVPQFVLWTHDDGIVDLTDRSFRAVADSRRNPNGCPVRTTMFTTEMDTDCDLAYGLWKDGYEIASHTADHKSLGAGVPLNETVAQIMGAKNFLARECGIPADEIRGFRNPYLITNPLVRQVLFDNGFLYDSTLLEAADSESLSSSMAKRVWPYSLDFGIPQNCAWFGDTQKCDKAERWPGVWEVPLWVLQVLGLEFTMDVGFYGGRGVYEPLRAAFDASYSGNRAPLPIYVHTTWVEKDPSRLDELKQFADYTLGKGDVYWVTMSQLLAWMKDPVPASQLRKSRAMCERPAPPQATPALPASGANVTLTFAGATATQVADQRDRLEASVARLLGSQPAGTFVAAVRGGPTDARRRLLAQQGGDLTVTVVAAGADPLALFAKADAAEGLDAMAGELSAMGLQLAGQPEVVPFKAGMALALAAPAPAPAPIPAPTPERTAATPAPSIARPAPDPAPAGPTTEPTPGAPTSQPAAATNGGSTAAPASSGPAPAAPTTLLQVTTGSSGLGVGVIAGIAVGGVAIVALLAGIAALLLRSRPCRNHSAKQAATIQEPPPAAAASKQAKMDQNTGPRLDIVVTTS